MAQRIVLRPYDDSMFYDYLAVQREISPFRQQMFDPSFRELLHETMQTSTSPTYLAYRTTDDVFIGQCGTNSTAGKSWELGIGVLAAHQGQGYGREMLVRLVRILRATYGQTRFHTCVDAGNAASIALMRSLGATPGGVERSPLLPQEADAELFEMMHPELIKPSYDKLAREFGVSPRKLISHALVFNIDELA
ncbi:MAG: GNAT family N-acetyltransferase [Atopobiaceae bacterium]|nr:GNAT family N-acetyltransferase [Atopobiaceae bacterium]